MRPLVDDEVTLRFDRGTLLLDGPVESLPTAFVSDERVGLPRAPATSYRTVFAALHRALGDRLTDEARAYEPVELAFRMARTPYDHQFAAVEAWSTAGRRGLVVLPTGSGKTYVAHLAMERVSRSTLIVVPTIDLLNQWYAGLLSAFSLDEVGLVGGGYYDIRPLTVTTYDSFHIHAEQLGNRFGLLVFDECHHLPSPSYSQAASCFIAPFRLGLTATPERDGEGNADEIYGPLVGSVVYRREIKSLAGQHLADYDTQQVVVELDEAEREEYQSRRQIYLDFIRSNGIRMGSADGWRRFIMLSSGSARGRQAMLSYRRQRQIALSCRAKFDTLELLLNEHVNDRVLAFTNDNDTAYRISRRFLIPIITHKTPIKERRQILEGFKIGTYRALVTSKVLNEGVDIPEANIAVVLGGSGTVREHVQRLGRILRRLEGKRALLYEVITNDTMESWVSEKRRDHDAYR